LNPSFVFEKKQKRGKEKEKGCVRTSGKMGLAVDFIKESRREISRGTDATGQAGEAGPPPPSFHQ
jgi:hypothetical protein